MSFYYLGHACMELKRFGEAATLGREGVTTLEKMIERGVGVAEARQQLAFFDSITGIAEQGVAESGSWEEVIALPDERLAELLEMRAQFRLDQGDYESAAQAALALIDDDQVTESKLIRAAKLLTRAAAASIKTPDEEPLTEAMNSQRTAWLEGAVRAIEKAVASGWKDFDRLKADPNMAPLIETEAFQSLLPKEEPSDQEAKPGETDVNDAEIDDAASGGNGD